MSEEIISVAELRESVHGFLAAEIDLKAIREDSGQRETALAGLWSSTADLGWPGLIVPASYGGLGLGTPHLACLHEQLGYFLAPLPILATQLAADCLLLAGNSAQKERWLGGMAAGKVRATLGLPVTALELPGLDAQNRVTGTLVDVPDGLWAAQIIVPVQRGREVYFAILDRDTEGVRVTSRAIIDLTRSLADVHMASVHVPAERLLPATPAAWTGILDRACLALAADSVGGASRILTDTIAYIGQRRQFGRAIGSFQALKHRVATWKIRLEGAGALMRHCAEQLADAAPAASGLASATKASATEIYCQIAGDAIQLHGGIGFTWDHECHMFLKRARLSAVLFGGTMQHRDRAAAFTFGASPSAAATESVRRFFSFVGGTADVRAEG
jgi:alkylation response protein AidB-like acyl-CoA dehydrogenase